MFSSPCADRHGDFPVCRLDDLKLEMKIKKFVLKEKLSKKARKLLDAQKRVLWDAPPVSRIVPNKKKDHLQKMRSEQHDLGE